MAWLVRCAIVAIVSQFVWSVVLSSAVNDIQIRGSKFDINNYRVSVTSKTAEKWSHFFGKLTAPALLVAQTNSTVQKIRSSTTPKIVEFKSMISNWWRSVVSKRGKRTDIELKQGIGKLYDEVCFKTIAKFNQVFEIHLTHLIFYFISQQKYGWMFG